ncbi:MAG TPA: ferritin-like domain-containing protein [Burkholderiaceae bacterium]
MITENERWILSYYRTSEISGSMFFARLAKSIRNPDIQRDLTGHFADEAQHARYWSDCLQQLDAKPIRLGDAYQDQYFDAVGVPVNLMEVLAITQVFESRTINHYAGHSKRVDAHPLVRETIGKIMDDEGWHLKWVTTAIKAMEPEYGQDHVRATLARYKAADQEIYEKTLKEYDERFRELIVEA